MKKYDVVVVGSGLGGLSSAYMLAKEGMSVCVLEKNRQFGGNLQIFSREKAIFDTGVHYLGGLDKGQNLHQFFKYLDIIDKLKLKKLDENGFDRICFDGDDNEYPHAMGYENFVERLSEFFPRERRNLEAYCAKIREVCRAFPLYNLEYSNGDYLEKTLPYLTTGVTGFIDKITSNEKLRNVLAGTIPLYAGEPDKTPLYIHALIINSYIESAYRCVDGGSQIARFLVENIKNAGGVIRNYAECKRFIFSGDKVKYVELEDGETIEGESFISNIHPANTLEMVEPGKLRKPYLQRINSLENSISAFILNIIFHKNTFPYLNYNLYYYKDPRVWEIGKYDPERWPVQYSLFVPAASSETEYSDHMSVMVYMNYSEVKKWESTFNTIPRHRSSRGEDYEAFKNEKAERLLTEIEKKFPGLKPRIKSWYTSTPLTYRDYIGTKDGSMYGITKDYKDPMKTFIHSRTKIPNLLLTGQNIHVHGVLGVTIGAILTASELLGTDYLLKRIRET